MFGPPMTVRGTDVAENLAAWEREWQRTHPAIRWMFGLACILAFLIGSTFGLILGLVL